MPWIDYKFRQVDRDSIRVLVRWVFFRGQYVTEERLDADTGQTTEVVMYHRLARLAERESLFNADAPLDTIHQAIRETRQREHPTRLPIPEQV